MINSEYNTNSKVGYIF